MFKLAVPTAGLRNGRDLADVLRAVAEHVKDLPELPQDSWDTPTAPFQSYVHEHDGDPILALYRVTNEAGFRWHEGESPL